MGYSVEISDAFVASDTIRNQQKKGGPHWLIAL